MENYLLCFLIILIAFNVFFFIISMQWTKSKNLISLQGILLLLKIIVFILIRINLKEEIITVNDNMTILITDLLLIDCLIMIISFIYIRKKRFKDIGPISIKESLDKLPMALCYSKLNGFPVLTNDTMNRICYELTGKTMLNAERFYEKLVENSNYINGMWELILDEENVYTFNKKTIKLKGDYFIQIVGIPVTDLYEMKLKLSQENERLKKINEELIEYSHNVNEVTKKEEILNTKILIHDSMGRILLASKKWILDNDYLKYEQIISKWKEVVTFLNSKGDNPDENLLLFDQLKNAAKSIGMEIKLIGNVPEDEEIMEIFIAAARTHVINAASHANADEVNIYIEEKNGHYKFIFKNTGIKPEKEIGEGGGLSSLRKKITQAGGEMRIISRPEFVLEIKI